MKFGYYLKLNYDPKQRAMDWVLDYSRLSDIGEPYSPSLS
jgi:hypothetical protein